ncbi:MAG: hypothetical protein ACR2NA_12435 [Solirubrobacterales bacterium]
MSTYQLRVGRPPSPTELAKPLRQSLGDRYDILHGGNGFLIPAECVIVARSPWVGVAIQAREGENGPAELKTSTVIPSARRRTAFVAMFFLIPVFLAIAFTVQFRATQVYKDIDEALGDLDF